MTHPLRFLKSASSPVIEVPHLLRHLTPIRRHPSGASLRPKLRHRTCHSGAPGFAASLAALGPNKGLKKKVLPSLPKLTYSPDLAAKLTDCPICPSEFVDGDEIRVLRSAAKASMSFASTRGSILTLHILAVDRCISLEPARETKFGREVPAFDVEATTVEPVFQQLYTYTFNADNMAHMAPKIDRPLSIAIFIVRIDPQNKEIDIDSLMFGQIHQLSRDEMNMQEGSYMYRYRYNGGGPSQLVPAHMGRLKERKEVFVLRQLGALVATTVEHVIAPDVRCVNSYMSIKMSNNFLL
ncbi:hypothetical protein V2J09_022862 [Rumex salicifolius]